MIVTILNTSGLLTVRFYIFLLLWGVIYSQSYGQTTSPKDRFQVDVNRGCAPLTVTATNLYSDLTDGIVWNPEWDGDEGNIVIDPDAAPETLVHIYDEPGTYRLLHVIGNADASGPIDTLIIEVLEPRVPQFQLLNCTENRVFVDIQDDYYDLLEIDFGDGTPLEIVSTDQPSFIHQYAVAGEYTVNVQGLFNVPDNAGCADSIATFNTFVGGGFPVATLSEVEVIDETSIRVAYGLPVENVSYQLQLTDEGGSTTSYPLSSGSTEIVVNQDDWNTRENYYCVSVVAVDPCEPGNVAPANQLCSIALQATAENLQNNLSWRTRPDWYTSYPLFRDGEPLVTVDPPLADYEDTDIVCQQPYSYQIVASNPIGVSRSEAISLTAINTTVPAAVPNLIAGLQDVSITLTWPEVADVQQYYVYRAPVGTATVRYDSIVPNVLTLPYEDSNVEVDQEYCYQVSYLDECGNESVLSEEVCQRVPARAQLYFPDAFTPNGDGLNDTFLYKASLLESITFEVFNRWGEQIFRTSQLDVGWDGTYNGTLAPEGTYLYMINVTDQLGNRFAQNGKFVLLNPNIR